MEKLIKKYDMKFYMEDPKKMAEWGEWKLIIGDKEYPTPYKSYSDWEIAMEAQNAKDTTRIMQRNIEKRFSGGVYDEIDKIIKGEQNDDNE